MLVAPTPTTLTCSVCGNPSSGSIVLLDVDWLRLQTPLLPLIPRAPLPPPIWCLVRGLSHQSAVQRCADGGARSKDVAGPTYCAIPPRTSTAASRSARTQGKRQPSQPLDAGRMETVQSCSTTSGSYTGPSAIYKSPNAPANSGTGGIQWSFNVCLICGWS